MHEDRRGGIIAGVGGLRRMLVLVVAAGAVAAPAAAAQDRPPSVAWERLLPALPGPGGPQPGPVPGCEDPSIACVDAVIERLSALRDELGCDHRAVFATTYLELTRELRDVLGEDPGFFADPDYFFAEDALFAQLYFAAIEAHAQGRPVPSAWAIAFRAAERGDASAAQDMLLGINAHVQRDMPHVLAALGLRTADGASRKPDHDRANEVLARAYERVVRAVGGRYDPTVSLTNPSWHPVDDVAGLELVRGWREGVWRNAERLVRAGDDRRRRASVERSIEVHAAAWAQAIAAGEMPGHRARRAAYCASRASASRP